MTTIQNAAFAAVLNEAIQAGRIAGEECVPQPVVFYRAGTDPADGERVDDGLCGFAWVNIAGNTAFARWLKKHTAEREAEDGHNYEYGVHKGYPKGLDLWCRGFNQSHERKRAWAQAVAARLREAGIKAYPGDRLD